MQPGQLKFTTACLSVLLLLAAQTALAQTTSFTYQGKLHDAGQPANANYEMQFRLFDNPMAGQGTQQGATITRPTVAVSNGLFNVELDFGAAVFASGADRFLEISLRPAGSTGGYISLAPRQKLTSAPYAIRSKEATTTDSLSSACVGCVQDANIDSVAGNKVTGVVANATNSSQLGGLNPGRYVQFDANDNVSIGTTGTGSKVTVAGVIESTAGGIKFPDATEQKTAGLTTVTTDATLTGDGTSVSPLGVASPLLVRDLDNPALQPFRASSSTSNATLVTVPAGKRLVIEFISGATRTTGINSAGPLQLFATGMPDFIYIAPNFTRTDGSDTIASFTHPVRFYLSPGDELRVFFAVNATFRSITVTGYYVDLPK